MPQQRCPEFPFCPHVFVLTAPESTAKRSVQLGWLEKGWASVGLSELSAKKCVSVCLSVCVCQSVRVFSPTWYIVRTKIHISIVRSFPGSQDIRLDLGLELGVILHTITIHTNTHTHTRLQAVWNASFVMMLCFYQDPSDPHFY